MTSRDRRAIAILIAAPCVAAASGAQVAADRAPAAHGVVIAGATSAVDDTSLVRFHWQGARLGHPPPQRVVNANGSPRIADTAAYAAVLATVGPLLERWARDPRLDIDPNFVAALLTKESGGDTLAVSAVPALGLAQLTAAADTDLRTMTASPALAWMRREVERWPRSAAVHDSAASRRMIDSLLAGGALTSRTEYLFDPRASARAAVLWLHVLDLKWTTDDWPGGYGTFARTTLAHGGALDETQLVDLITVSYNVGYRAVHDLVARYGPSWTAHLDDLGPAGGEAADYLERVRSYARLFAVYADSSSAR